MVPLFFSTIAAATYFMATASSPLVPLEVPFGFVYVLPIQYWILLLVTVLLLAASIISRRVPFLWVAAICLTAVVPGLSNLIDQEPRDIFALVATQYISRSGTFNPAQHIYLNFPGSEIIFSSLTIVTKADATSVIRAYGMFYNLLLLGLCYVSFRRFGVSQVPSILGALTLVLGFYAQGVLIYSSLNGFLFYILVASLVLMPVANLSKNMMLLALFFAAMTITHAFSPFLTLAGVSGVLIGGAILGKFATRRAGFPLSEVSPRVSLSIIAIFLLVAAILWAYFSFGPFAKGISTLSSINLTNLLEGVFSPLLAPQTAYEVSYARFATLYAPVLFVPFVIYLLAVPDKRRAQMLLLTLGLVAAVVIAIVGYTEEFLIRLFAFALLPLSYGISKLFESRRRTLKAVGFIALALVLVLHIPAHYGQDAFQVYPISSLHGVEFIAQHSHPNSKFDSTVRELSWSYYFNVYRSDQPDKQAGTFYYVLDYAAASWLIYNEGDNAYFNLTLRLNSRYSNLVYSNGLMNIYQS